MIEFDYDSDYILEDDIALLRPLKQQDLEHLLYATGQPGIWEFSTQKWNSKENMETYINLALEGRKAKKEYPFIIIDKRTNGFAGCTRFYDIKLNQHNLSLGYTWYGQQYQATGLNKHCKYLLFEFAFKNGFERVEFSADTKNLRSIAAMKGVGCTQEGVLRSHTIRLDGSRRDTVVLSMLKSEWEQSLKEKLWHKLTG